jgi:hypothetical protein
VKEGDVITVKAGSRSRPQPCFKSADNFQKN